LRLPEEEEQTAQDTPERQRVCPEAQGNRDDYRQHAVSEAVALGLFHAIGVQAR
jgi:hypothetical protein